MNDALAGAIWLVVNALAVAGAARICRRALPRDNGAQIAMHAIVLLWAAIVGVSVALGALGALCWQTLGAAMFLISAAALVWLRNSCPVAGLDANGTAEDLRHARESVPYGRGANYAAWLWGALAALAGGIVVDRLLGFPRHWDDLMYHLPLVDHWLQDGRLYVPACTEWYNPGNGELLGLWCVAPFSGDFWVGVANLPVMLLLILATVELGLELGLPFGSRQGVAVAVVATNVALTQLADLENDMAVAALFAAGLAYGVRFARSGHRPDLWLTATSLALLAGVKYYALGYAAVGGAGMVGLALALRGRQAAVRLFAALFAASLPLAGYWYARNWFVTGTPVFPLGFSAATDVLESVRPSAFRTTFFGNGRADLWVQYFGALRQLTGICHVVAVALIPSTAVWLLASSWFFWRDRRDSKTAWLRASLAVLLLGSVCVFGVTPFTVMDDDERKINGAFTVVRYSQCPLLLALLGTAVVFDDAARAISALTPRLRYKRLASAVGAALIAASIFQLGLQTRQIVNVDLLLIAVNIGLLCLLMVQVVTLTLLRTRCAAAVACAIAVALFAGSSAWLSGRWHAGYATNFDHLFATQIFTRLENEGRPASIAVADYRYYPFFGSRRQFRAHRPFRILSRDALDSYLTRFKINILAVVRRDPFRYGRYRGLADMVADDTERFEKLESRASFAVYRVRQPIGGTPSDKRVRTVGTLRGTPRAQRETAGQR